VHRRRFAAIAALLLALVRPAAAEAAADPGGSVCSPVEVAAALFVGVGSACDVNDDGAVTAADLSAAVLARKPAPTASPTPTVTATPTPTPPPPCPTAAASIIFEIDNRTQACELEVALSGMRLGNECTPAALATEYARTLSCSGCGLVTCGGIDALAPGTWRHSLRVNTPATGQVQHRPGILVAGAEPQRLRFTAFASVLTVSSIDNAGPGSLRSRLQAAAPAAKPALIQFDPEIFPPGRATTINLEFQLTALATDDVTIDGTDATGASGNRIVDAQGLPIGAFSVGGARNHIVGMHFRNAGANNRDVLNISGSGAHANVIERTQVHGAASADGIGVDQGAGRDFDATVNIVRDCVISGAADKGIKVTQGSHLRVERSWIYGNANGGIQATLGGHLQSWHNLIENNSGLSAQNGIAANSFEAGLPGSESSIDVCGSISRSNGGDGVSVRGASMAAVRDSYLATNGAAGLRVFNDLGDGSRAVVEGTSTVCNQVDGAVVTDDARVDFGGGVFASAGNNAFAQNNLAAGAVNLRNTSSSFTTAINNQWEHCGNGDTCDIAAIAARDLSDRGGNTFFVPAQAHRALPPPVVHAVNPTKGREGDLLRIFGSGFNVVDGLYSETRCEDVGGRNRCLPLRGNCVRIGGIPATIEAVTPTMIVARWPFTCVEPVPLVITVDQGVSGNVGEPFAVCGEAAADPCAAARRNSGRATPG
jgi:hypothetical protein